MARKWTQHTLVCLIDEQGLISAQGGIYQKINKRTGPNHYYTVVPNKSAQGGFFFKKNKRPWSCIRHTGVTMFLVDFE